MYHYKKTRINVDLGSSMELMLPIAVCKKCGIVEPRVDFAYSVDYHVLEWWHCHPLSFLFLYEKEKKRSYEVEDNNDDNEFKKVLVNAGEAWTRQFSYSDILAEVRKRLMEIQRFQ
jgi:hypothetical protein